MTVPAIYTHLMQSARVKEQVAHECTEDAMKASSAISSSLKSGGKLLLCGNGGSAGDAQHLAAEFVATLDHARPRQGLRAMALTTDTSFITAYSNDFDFVEIFARQVEVFGDQNDVLIGISTSGNSANIVAALKKGQALGLTTIAMTGEGGGNAATYANIVISVPSSQTALVQESHIALGHAMTAEVERHLGYC